MQKYSKLFIKTKKGAKEFDSINATLLQKAGFIHQEMAGVYSFLPLGYRVLTKIENIIRNEINKIGTELLMSSLAPKEIWEQTGRLNMVDVLMKTVGANEISKQKSTHEYILSCTHEDMVTPIAQENNQSYKDFPFAFYQIQTKFRNEARAKSGLLRGREFRMKDLYSFHTSLDDLMKYYEESKEIYWNIFHQLGLGDDTVLALASGGDFTKNYSHEFQVRCEAGEDLIFHDSKSGISYNLEVTPSKAPVIHEDSVEMLERKDVEGVGVIGVEELSQFLNIPVEKTTKTILFETEKGIVAAAVRGGYEIDEEKLKKVIGVEKIVLASPETVKQVTGAEVGYAGVLNLSQEIIVIMDESMQGRRNFQMGANKTNFHSININFDRDIKLPEQFYDIKVAKEGDMHPETGAVYEVFKACEVGNIFPLETKFTKAFNYTFTDEEGNQKIVYMGSYGIGPSRVMGVIVEKFHDEKGIVWPKTVAPYDVHFITLGINNNATALTIMEKIESMGLEVLWDDRDGVSAGMKFADADLIGIPLRIVLSDRSLENGGVEVKYRNQNIPKIVPLDEVTSFLK